MHGKNSTSEKKIRTPDNRGFSRRMGLNFQSIKCKLGMHDLKTIKTEQGAVVKECAHCHAFGGVWTE